MANRKWIVMPLLILVAGWFLFRNNDEAENQAGSAPPPPTQADSPPSSSESDPIRPNAPAISLAGVITDEDKSLAFGAFDGVVLNAKTRLPITGAEITFASERGIETVHSDKAGSFSLVPSSLATHRLAVATAEGYLSYAPRFESRGVALQSAPGVRLSSITITLIPVVNYSGSVVDAEGLALPGASIQLLHADTGEQSMAPLVDTYESDKKGEFVFQARDFSVLRASHTAEDGAERVGLAAVSPSVQLSHKLVIVVKDPPNQKAIAGVVMGPDHVPLEQVLVQAHVSEGLGWRMPVETRTDSEGMFRFAPPFLSDIRYQLRASFLEYATAFASAVPGDEDVHLELATGGSIRGQVLSKAGKPIASFTVVVMTANEIGSRTIATESFFDSQGHFEIRGVPAGEHVAIVAAHGFAQSEPTSVVALIPPNEPRRTTIVLSGGGTAFGQVVDDEGKPLEGAEVSLENYITAGSLVPLVATTSTDEQGGFELSGLQTGLRTLSVSAFNHHQRLFSGVAITEGTRVGPLAIVLEATVEGEPPKLETTGLGIAVSKTEEGILVGEVIPGGGGHEVGLVNGDVILSIDGESVQAIGFGDAIQRIRGPVGTKIVIGVRRAETSLVDTINATRRKVRI